MKIAGEQCSFMENIAINDLIGYCEKLLWVVEIRTIACTAGAGNRKVGLVRMGGSMFYG